MEWSDGQIRSYWMTDVEHFVALVMKNIDLNLIWFAGSKNNHPKEMSVMRNVTSANNTQVRPLFFGHNLSAEFSLVAGLCFLAVIVVAVICNGVLITCIVLTRRLHSALHVFIVNLAACDVITAVGSVPFDVDYMWRGFFPYEEVFIIICYCHRHIIHFKNPK